MVKTNFTNNQVAFSYAIYMMVGSYFQKTICKNLLLERKMRLQFVEQKMTDQYKMEDICLDYIEKKMLKKLPENFWNEEMKVRFFVSGDQETTEIYFYNHKYMLCVKGQYAGKKSQIYYEVWKKK